MICELNRIAIDGLIDNPGQYRDGPAPITGSRHDPPPSEQVPGLVEEMCSAINSGSFSGIDRAAYALWRINWIHPFADGNGRTARAVAYFLICVWLEVPIPGPLTLPERIANEKRKYVRCLEEADRAWKRKRVNVSHLAGFLSRLTGAQLREALAEIEAEAQRRGRK